jgi:hypothetical protein
MRRLALAYAAGMLTLPAVACVLAWLGARSFTATATPSTGTRATMWQVVTFLSRLDSLPPSVDAAWRSVGG